jgi:hypothetical protein
VRANRAGVVRQYSQASAVLGYSSRHSSAASLCSGLEIIRGGGRLSGMGLPPRHGAVAQPLTACTSPPRWNSLRTRAAARTWRLESAPCLLPVHAVSCRVVATNHLLHRGRHPLQQRRVRHGCSSEFLCAKDALRLTPGRSFSGQTWQWWAPSACDGGLSAFSGE